jgi:hypothetical protein
LPPENPSPEVPGGVLELIPSIPVPESSGKVVSFKIGENSIDASLVPTKDLLGVSGAEKLNKTRKLSKLARFIALKYFAYNEIEVTSAQIFLAVSETIFKMNFKKFKFNQAQHANISINEPRLMKSLNYLK